MIRWNFHYEEGTVSKEISNREDDEAISETLSLGFDNNYIYLPGADVDLYINLNRVKLVAREILADQEAIVDDLQEAVMANAE